MQVLRMWEPQAERTAEAAEAERTGAAQAEHTGAVQAEHTGAVQAERTAEAAGAVGDTAEPQADRTEGCSAGWDCCNCSFFFSY